MKNSIRQRGSFLSSGIYVYLLLLIFLSNRAFQFQEDIAPINFLYCLAIYWAGTFLFQLGFFRIFKNDQKANFMTSVLMVINFSFGTIKEYLEDVSNNGWISKYSFLFTASLLLMVISFVKLYKVRKMPENWSKWANLIVISSLVISNLFWYFSLGKKETDFSDLKISFPEIKPIAEASSPDVFIIVADGYAGRSELNNLFHFKNDPFYDSLRKRGFWVADSSRSNYRFTPFSIASTFCMNYLNHESYGIPEIVASRKKIYKNPFFQFFSNNGYEIKNYSIFDDPAAKNEETVDAFEFSGKQLLFHGTMLQHLAFLIDAYIYKRADIYEIDFTTANKIQKSNEYVVNQLVNERPADGNHPKLIYSHILAPHFPYLWDSSGKSYDENVTRSITRFSSEHYIKYLQGWNKIFLRTIDSIKSHSNNQAAILFFSDHGFRQFKKPVYFENYYTNLLSVYSPDQKYDQFYEGISNVNYLRAFLNQEFNQNLTMLKDSMVLYPVKGIKLKRE